MSNTTPFLAEMCFRLIMSQKIGKQDQLYAQLLQLGWAIIGESCLDGVHGQSSVNVLTTMLTPEPDQSSVMKPCPNKLQPLWSLASFLIFADHRATDFTLSKTFENAR